MIIKCAHCKKKVEKSVGHVNRANKVGLKLFCGRACFGLSRRVERTDAEWKEIKRLYDIDRRNDPVISMYRQLQALDYNESAVGRAMQKRNREKFKEKHLDYCRTPKYRAWKKAYDLEYVAKTKYGEFWESSIALNQIETILAPERKKIKTENGLLSKSQKRKRLWNSLQQTLKKHYGTP